MKAFNEGKDKPYMYVVNFQTFPEFQTYYLLLSTTPKTWGYKEYPCRLIFIINHKKLLFFET